MLETEDVDWAHVPDDPDASTAPLKKLRKRVDWDEPFATELAKRGFEREPEPQLKRYWGCSFRKALRDGWRMAVWRDASRWIAKVWHPDMGGGTTHVYTRAQAKERLLDFVDRVAERYIPEAEEVDWTVPDPEGPLDVSGAGVPEVERYSSVSPGSRTLGTAPQRVVLHRAAHSGEWVTHVQNMQTNGFAHGVYFRGDYPAAVENYVARCKKYRVEPL